MARPLSIQELLLAKSKVKDIHLLSRNGISNKQQPVQRLDASQDIKQTDIEAKEAEDSANDLDLLIDNFNTKKKVDKLTIVPKRSQPLKHGSSSGTFSQVLQNKDAKEMTSSDWDIYAKLNKIELNTLSFDKNSRPVRNPGELDINLPKDLQFDSLAQYTIRNLLLDENRNKGKSFLGVDNASSKRYSILCYMIPIIHALSKDKSIKLTSASSKPAPVAIVVATEDKIEDLQNKISSLESTFRGINLHSNIHLTTLPKLNAAIDKNSINYHKNLKFFIVDFLNPKEINKFDDLLSNMKINKITKAFFIRKWYPITEKQDDDSSVAIEQLLANCMNLKDSNGQNNTPKVFAGINIVKLR